MKERSKIFTTPEIQAILRGNKTMFRVPVKLKEFGLSTTNGYKYQFRDKQGRWNDVTDETMFKFFPFHIGQIIWVRETWCYVMLDHAPDLLEGMDSQTVYKASVHEDWMKYAKEKYGYQWHPSIHMPRSASRITLEVTGIKAERLQDISEEDAKKEGYVSTAKLTESGDDYTGFYASEHFLESWRKKHPVYSNPWVFAVTFKVIK